MGNFTWKQRYFSIFRKFKYLSSNVLLIIFSIIQWFLPQKWSQIWHFFSDFWDSASLIDSLFRCRNPHSDVVTVLHTYIYLYTETSNFSNAWCIAMCMRSVSRELRFSARPEKVFSIDLYLQFMYLLWHKKSREMWIFCSIIQISTVYCRFTIKVSMLKFALHISFALHGLFRINAIRQPCHKYKSI